MQRNQCLCGLAAVVLFFVCGCSTPGFLKFGSEEIPVEGPKNPVVQVLTMWQPATGAGLDQKQSRGFAGQIFFVTRDSPTPAKVDGSVTVWVFDDQGTLEQQGKAIHKFEFPAEAWNVHAHKTMLGMSYSVFIPYTRPGRHHANCTLRVRYTPREGAWLDSEMVNVELDGSAARSVTEKDSVARAASDKAEQEDSSIVQASAVRKRRRSADSPRTVNELVEAELFDDAAAAERPAPRPLTDAERDRIIRETRARLQDLNSSDEFEDSPPVARKRTANRRRQTNPLADDADEVDESEDDPGFVARRPARRDAAHDAFDEEPYEEDDAETRFVRRPATRQKRSVQSESNHAHRRHPLDEDEAGTGAPHRLHPLTIPLSDGL